MTAFASRLRENPIIPVLAVPSIDHAEELALALFRGGLKHIEVTLRTECALEAMKAMKQAAPELCIGMGTVLSDGDVDASLNAGAEFLVTPGTSPRLRDALISQDCPVMVGVATATEVMSRLEEGFGILKFFPAEQYGGASTLKSFSGPLKHAQFCPTGGVTLEKIPDYLALANVVAVGGTWIATTELIENKNWEKIEANARLAAQFAKTGN